MQSTQKSIYNSSSLSKDPALSLCSTIQASLPPTPYDTTTRYTLPQQNLLFHLPPLSHTHTHSSMPISAVSVPLVHLALSRLGTM